MAPIYTTLTFVVRCTLWFCQVIGASATANGFSVLTGGTVTTSDAVASKFMLSRSLKAFIFKAEARTLMAGTLLWLAVIFIVYYRRSPWRKLPPKPRGLPIIGNAVQVMDTKWLISNDCKERFREYRMIYSGARNLNSWKLQKMSCTLTHLDDQQSCLTA